MRVGPSSRTRKAHKVYIDHLTTKEPGCTFCAFTKNDHQVIKSYRSFWLVKNIFPYDNWDDNRVVDHLMIVPKRHLISLSELSTAEGNNLLKIIGEYEHQGYSLYARAPQNIAKSVLHQHSHLIKLGSQRKKFKLYIRKPHIMIAR